MFRVMMPKSLVCSSMGGYLGDPQPLAPRFWPIFFQGFGARVLRLEEVGVPGTSHPLTGKTMGLLNHLPLQFA